MYSCIEGRFMGLLGYQCESLAAVWAENESQGLQLLLIKLKTVCSHCVILSLSPSPDISDTPQH